MQTTIVKKREAKKKKENISHLSNIEVFRIMAQPSKISCQFSSSESLTSSRQTNLKRGRNEGRINDSNKINARV